MPTLFPSPILYPGPDVFPGFEASFADGIQASLLPLGPMGSDWQNANFALAQMFEAVWQIVYPQGTPDDPVNFAAGWSVLLNVQTCPTQFLPFLGMFVGVFVPPGTDDTTARALIANEQGFQRGTPAAILAAIERYLSPGQQVTLQERTAADGSTDPYHFTLVVLPPGIVDVAGATAAVNAVKPAGVQWTLLQVNGWLFDQATGTFTADTMTWQQTEKLQP